MSKDPEGWAFDFGCILHDNFNSDAVARIVVPFSAHGFRFAGTARPKTGFGMELLERLLFGSDSLWGGGVAHSVMILALVIALGIMLGKVKVAGVSLGVTGILFVGIAFSYFGMNIDEHLMHFLKEFGLILFVYSIGLQVGPGFFSSFRKGGITLNKLAVLVVALGVVTTVALYYVTGLPMTTMVGVMSGAVTNTPGLGAAQQAFSDLHAGADAPDIATGYALAYPLGVIGAILTLLALRYLLRIDVRQEEEAAGLGTDVLKDLTTRRISVEICNPAVEGKSISGIRRLALRDFVVSRICRPGEGTRGCRPFAAAPGAWSVRGPAESQGACSPSSHCRRSQTSSPGPPAPVFVPPLFLPSSAQSTPRAMSGDCWCREQVMAHWSVKPYSGFV